MDMPRPAGEARPTSIAASGISVRQSLAFIAFGAVYYLLAAYAAGLPIQAHTPLFIWPAHGVALGTLLVAPARRWPAPTCRRRSGPSRSRRRSASGWRRPRRWRQRTRRGSTAW